MDDKSYYAVSIVSPTPGVGGVRNTPDASLVRRWVTQALKDKALESIFVILIRPKLERPAPDSMRKVGYKHG